MANILEIGRFQFPNIRYYDVITVFDDVTNGIFQNFAFIWLVAYQMKATAKYNPPEGVSSDFGQYGTRMRSNCVIIQLGCKCCACAFHIA